MADARTPAKSDIQVRPPIPPRPKSALKSRITDSTPQHTHKRTKSDPSPSPSKKLHQEKVVRIDALSPVKKVQAEKKPLKIEIGEDLKTERSSISAPSPRTPKPKNVRSKVANNQDLSFSGRMAALVVAYDAYGRNPSPSNLQTYGEEITLFGFSCPQKPIRTDESEEEWLAKLEKHKTEFTDYNEYYSLHLNLWQQAKANKKLSISSILQQQIGGDQTTDQATPDKISPQPSKHLSPIVNSPERKTQSNGELAFDTPPKQAMVSDAHSINKVASPVKKNLFPKKPKSTSGFWSCCCCADKEEESDDMRYSQLPGEPAANKKL